MTSDTLARALCYAFGLLLPIGVFLAVLLLAGCVSPEQIAAMQDAKCRGAGC